MNFVNKVPHEKTTEIFSLTVYFTWRMLSPSSFQLKYLLQLEHKGKSAFLLHRYVVQEHFTLISIKTINFWSVTLIMLQKYKYKNVYQYFKHLDLITLKYIYEIIISRWFTNKCFRKNEQSLFIEHCGICLFYEKIYNNNDLIRV